MVVTKGNHPYNITNFRNGATRYEVVDATPDDIKELEKTMKVGDILAQRNGNPIYSVKTKKYYT